LQLKLSFISTGPVSRQLDRLSDHCVHKGDYEKERDQRNGEEKYPFIVSHTVETLNE
jgi:hypothetical protein